MHSEKPPILSKEKKQKLTIFSIWIVIAEAAILSKEEKQKLKFCQLQL